MGLSNKYKKLYATSYGVAESSVDVTLKAGSTIIVAKITPTTEEASTFKPDATPPTAAAIVAATKEVKTSDGKDLATTDGKALEAQEPKVSKDDGSSATTTGNGTETDDVPVKSLSMVVAALILVPQF